MKILKENAGLLTNFEVLDYLTSRGAAKDPTRVLGSIAPSEYKVYDYLAPSVASSQSRESINEFVDKCKPYKLTKAEIVNLISIRPTKVVELYPLIENIEERVESLEELVELVTQVFPVEKKEETKSDENAEAVE